MVVLVISLTEFLWKKGIMNIGDNLNRYSDKICKQIGDILEWDSDKRTIEW